MYLVLNNAGNEWFHFCNLYLGVNFLDFYLFLFQEKNITLNST